MTRQQVVPRPQEAIGMTLADESKGKKPDPPPDVDVMALPTRPLFWEQYRSQVEESYHNMANGGHGRDK